MKNSTHKIFVAALFTLLLTNYGAFACNLSDLTFLTLTQGVGQSCTITARLCVGLGITGATKGGDQGTTNIGIGFWDPVGGAIVTSFSPATITGPPPTNCLMTGGVNNSGAFGTRSFIGYAMPAICGASGYGCVTTTVACGNAQPWCTNFSFTLNRIPDSIRVFGAEGGGNFLGGCYPNPDMKIDLSAFPVIWGDIEGIRSTAGVNVKWTTVREVNTDYMTVERADESGAFSSIGQLPSVGNAQEVTRYEFFDRAPLPGINLYRVVEVDAAGSSYDSQIIEIDYFKPSAITWGSVGPNPATDFVDLSFYSPTPQSMNLMLCDVTGKLVISKSINAAYGGNAIRLDLETLNRGAYFLSLSGSGDKLTRKIVKL